MDATDTAWNRRGFFDLHRLHPLTPDSEPIETWTSTDRASDKDFNAVLTLRDSQGEPLRTHTLKGVGLSTFRVTDGTTFGAWEEELVLRASSITLAQ